MCNSYICYMYTPVLNEPSKSPRNMQSTANSMEVSGCPSRCLPFVATVAEVRMRKVSELYKMYRELPVFQVYIKLKSLLMQFDFTFFPNICLKCWFRPWLTHSKSSAMKMSLVVEIQPCPFILRLLSFTLLTGLVNNEH